jgi:hypothetical protein
MQGIGVLVEERRPEVAYATFSHKGRRKEGRPAFAGTTTESVQ